MPDVTLRGERVVLRPAGPDDLDRFGSILEEPAVARWWNPPPPEGAAAAWLEHEADAEVFAIELDGRVVGSIQYAEQTDPDYRHAGIDIFLATDVHGQGVGTDAVRTVARYLIDVLGHHRLTIDPSAANERRHPRLLEGGIPADRHPAPVRARPGRHVPRQPLHGPARRRLRRVAERVRTLAGCSGSCWRRATTAWVRAQLLAASLGSRIRTWFDANVTSDGFVPGRPGRRAGASRSPG